MASWSIPERYCKLSLYRGQASGKDILARLTKNARISFNTSETVSGAINEAVIEIGGLDRNTMGYLSTSYSQWNVNPIRNEIIIDAGYGNRHGIVFDGDIIEASPNLDSADFSIRLRALSYYEAMVENVYNVSFQGSYPVSEIASQIASQAGLGFVNALNKEVYVNDYNYPNANLQSQMRYLAQVANIDVYTQGDKLVIKDSGGVIGQFPAISITTDDIIGSPDPNPMGCTVKIRMNPSLRTGQRVKLTSKRFNILNSDKYVIQTISHSGDTKGSKWFTTVTLIREDIYNV